MMEYMVFYNIPFTIVATKADKLSKNQVAHNLKRVKDVLKMSKELICNECGKPYTNLIDLTSNYCPKNKDGSHNGRHIPAE